MSLEKQDETKLEVFPEAGGVAFTTIYSKTGLPINITARATDPFGAVQSLVQAITKAMAEYEMTTEKPMPPSASAPAQNVAVKIAQEAGNPEMAKEIQASAEAVPPSRKGADVAYQTFDADIVEDLPQPDEKVTLAFYGTNDKYPRVKVNKWKIAAANGLMKHVTAEDMGKAAKYSLRCRVYYTDGSAYTTAEGVTGHYKDIEHVRPL